jgi:hypothetical protein
MLLLQDKFTFLSDLPSMPVLLMEALQYMNDKQSLTKLADKISQDSSMTVRILRIANSPFYGMSREIGSLREASILLGLNRSLSASVFQPCCRPGIKILIITGFATTTWPLPNAADNLRSIRGLIMILPSRQGYCTTLAVW